jgi:hypothetical protein
VWPRIAPILQDTNSPATRPLSAVALLMLSQSRLLTELRLQKAGCDGNVCVRLAMTLVYLLQLERFCANLRKPQAQR